jgi:hypothetical protein
VNTAVVEAFSRSIVTVFLWAIPFAAISFFLVLAMPEHPLRDTAHIGAGPGPSGEGPAAPGNA